ncbi:ABC transporter permease [Anaeromyxobacter paludicola]|uniref:Sulfonate ABC transporter permease n=1 Tax=Anaeromyxobacter paludicola TaxID=2918171 RepID=A0ABM7XEL2_9BACT|nr:ABC transporter permease [Anaeromyxobacter paludicola]BDG10319.1 sulfonate ABC transporter permease [Anaeromyxobacter paludicola]
MRARLVPLLRAVLIPVAVLLFWEWLARSGRVSPQILPPPSQVARRWVAYLLPLEPWDPAGGRSRLAWLFSGELPGDAVGSLKRVLVGFVIGGGLALPLGLLMGAKDWVYQLFDPLVQILRPIPPIAFIPLSILWFGLGDPPAYFLISLGAFFPVLMNTIAGVRSVDAIYIRAARNLGAGQQVLFRRVILPAATPYILTGVRVGVGVAFIVVIVAEMIAVNSGLGYRILEAREFFWSDKIIAGMFSIGLAGLGIDLGMNALNRRLLRWHRGLEQGR